MKYMFLLLIGAVAFSACTTKQPQVTMVPSATFSLQETLATDSAMHMYLTTSNNSSQFISFSQKDLNELCKQATASGGVK